MCLLVVVKTLSCAIVVIVVLMDVLIVIDVFIVALVRTAVLVSIVDIDVLDDFVDGVYVMVTVVLVKLVVTMF